MRLPVRMRLTLAFAVVMALVLGAAGVFVHGRMESNLDQGIATALRSRAADVSALAQQSDAGLREARTSAIARRAQIAQILDPRGRVIDATPGLPAGPLIPAGPLAQARRGSPVTRDTHLPGRGPVRLLATSVRAQDLRLVVVVGQPLTERDQALSGLTNVLLIGGPAALLLASFAGYLLAAAALRPVEALRRRAAAISAADLDTQLPVGPSKDELGRLGRTLNEMLARIHASVSRERTFVADASHELRTPLTMIRTELELIARDQPSGLALQHATRSAIEEADRLSRLADDLLLLTRADHGERLEAEQCTTVSLLATAATRARRRAHPGTAEITVDDSEPLTFTADRLRVGRALDNMIDNALRHTEHRVELAARIKEHSVELHVLDDGPGFPPEFLPHAWERFARADTARTEDHAGLGLAIVQTIATLHQGQAHATNRHDGGADVWIALPLAGMTNAQRLSADTDGHPPTAPSSTPASHLTCSES
jgi:signal transduction histidine kinase